MDIRAMVEILMRAVVVHDVAVQLGIHRLVPERDALLGRVVDHEVDEMLARATRFDRRQNAARRRAHDLEAPERDVGTIRPQCAVNRGTLTRILAVTGPPPRPTATGPAGAARALAAPEPARTG